MAPLIKCYVFLLLSLEGGFCAEEFRVDYEWSDQAGGWLKYHAEPATWEEARLRCQAEGTVLASPLNEKLKSAIVECVQNQKSPEIHFPTIFIGVHSIFSKGDYASIEGVPLKRLDITWTSGEPDNFKNSENCLTMDIDYSKDTADTRCDRELTFVCYKNVVADKQYRYDYEWSELAGGWLNYHEIPSTWDEAKRRCEAEGAVLATPLNKHLETAIITFVQNQETDTQRVITIFTGVQDTSNYASQGAHNNFGSCSEMTIGYSGKPNTRYERVLPYVCYKKDTKLIISACGTTDPEYVLDPRTGSCYKFHSERLSWSEAYMTCMGEGGYLAVINNNVEATVVKEIFAKHPPTRFPSDFLGPNLLYVGFHNWGSKTLKIGELPGTNFNTIHGEPLQQNYHTWASDQPDNGTNIESGDIGEFCGAISRTGELHDSSCKVQTVFLCEKSPSSLSNDIKIV